MRAYTLLSHTGALLAYQVTLARRHLPELEGITVVQGPHGRNRLLSAGDVAIRPDVAAREGLAVLDAPTTLLGRSWPVRRALLFDWLLTAVIPRQAEETALILHGDLMPLSSMGEADLLGGRGWAGRGPQPESGMVFLTWLLLRREAARPLADVDLGDFTAWPARSIRSEADGHLEWCEPGWLHLDRMAWGRIGEEKIRYLRERAGLELEAEEWTWQVEAPDVTPRHHRG